MMTTIQQQAVELISELSDEKVYYLISFIKAFQNAPGKKDSNISQSMKAYQNLQKYRKEGTTDIDYKAELHSAWEEKHENID